jgi:flagella basal body P-ring formation protein FlgA
MARWFVIVLVTTLLAAASRADVSITLRTVARIDAGTPLTIGTVAAVTGDPSIESVPLAFDTAGAGRFTIGIDDVRGALIKRGVRRAGVTVRGDACAVIVRESQAAVSTETQPVIAALPEPTQGERTVRDHVRDSLERSLGIEGNRLRLMFDPNDQSTLARATAGVTVDVHATGLSRRTPVRVTLYHGDGSIEVLRLRVGVQVLRNVARVSRSLPRGTTLQLSDFTVSQEWLVPDEPHLDPADAVGQRVRRTVDTGDRLTSASVEPPIVIERGDIVMVHVVSGAVILRQESRALDAGRVGERIRLEPISGGQAFQAAVEGPGRAVIMAGPSLTVDNAS